jgi:hypothetical protein
LSRVQLPGRRSYNPSMKQPAALALVLLGFGCSSAVTPSPLPDPASAAKSRGSLGTLRTRDRDVLLDASPTGLKITVKAKNGATLADRVDLDALRTLDPHIYELCRSGVASGRPSYLDATLDTRHRGAESHAETPATTPHWRR